MGRWPTASGGARKFWPASPSTSSPPPPVVAPDIEILILARFQALAPGVLGLVLGRAVVRDVYGREGAAQILSYMGMATLAPAFGPIIGGYLNGLAVAALNFLVLLAFAVVILLAVVTILPETNRWKDPRRPVPASGSTYLQVRCATAATGAM